MLLLIYIYIYIERERGWSNTVGNLNEGFRVTQIIHRVFFDFLGGTDLTHACAHFAFLADVPHILNHVHVQVPLLCDVATHDHQAGVLGTTPGFAYQ